MSIKIDKDAENLTKNDLAQKNGFTSRKPLTRFSSFGSTKQTNNNRQSNGNKKHSFDSQIKSINGKNITGAFDNRSFINDSLDKNIFVGGFV